MRDFDYPVRIFTRFVSKWMQKQCYLVIRRETKLPTKAHIHYTIDKYILIKCDHIGQFLLLFCFWIA